MITSIKRLHQLLRLSGYHKVAQQVEELSKTIEPLKNSEEYSEPWHEEVVQEFGGEPISEDEYLDQINFPLDKKPFYLDYNEVDLPTDLVKKLFDQHEIKLVSATGKSQLIGYGSFGAVFRVVYKGKPGVAKLIINELKKINEGYLGRNDREAENWKKIQDNLDKFPTKLRKHLPIIYDIIDGKIDAYLEHQDIGFNQLNYQIIIMEELFPLSKYLKQIFKQPSEYSYIIKDEEFVNTATDYLYHSVWYHAAGLPKNIHSILSNIQKHDMFPLMERILETWAKYPMIRCHSITGNHWKFCRLLLRYRSRSLSKYQESI